MARYRAVMDCFEKIVSLTIDGSDDTVEFVGEKKPRSTRLISALKAERLVRSGCEGYIAFISEDKKSKGVEEIPVVCEFPDVFPDEIPGLPPVREIDFTIELVPGTAPISRADSRLVRVWVPCRGLVQVGGLPCGRAKRADRLQGLAGYCTGTCSLKGGGM